MNFITGTHLPRRTFLRGAGAAMALPFLDAMVPAARTRREMLADPTRLICVEEVHGQAGCNVLGASKYLWAPEQTGRNYTLAADNSMSPLEPFRNEMTIVSNTDVKMAEAFATPEIGGDHFRSSAVFLTQSHPKQTQGSDVYVGTSLDQIVARRIAGDTAIPSMQLCIENQDRGGGCDYNYACAYTDTLSWASPTEPL